ncbi:hypothetical protein ERO13_A08G071100v2 [Gossypium hirsutum]|uniref:Uncharacterized protein n=4 Tax=Gossypium TaxID=3633 RepID=A0A5J5UNC6_GOSBA|nr:hypothetical protein ES319_A08G078300v1 [Gossypium barbadense]KAG4186886.1 hypothetical protein ERO13_A08G071100v2 [Gossypium hirsutum]TYH05442.1 hypothetical protein ES288_A08G083600v1 [Gossypium darwinii]TYI13819.1 hypothetical protein ES332_A08G084600v1 [Gossypium tomentosum]TYJ21732.1 hypothetical protein E1A91_A08G082200v1 [Gossypium mustelinum]
MAKQSAYKDYIHIIYKKQTKIWLEKEAKDQRERKNRRLKFFFGGILASESSSLYCLLSLFSLLDDGAGLPFHYFGFKEKMQSIDGLLLTLMNGTGKLKKGVR